MLKRVTSFFSGFSNPSAYPFEKLRLKHKDLSLYAAGYPRYRENFTRDALISGILTTDARILHDQLIYSGMHQGITRDLRTGEEPGKIFHELPGGKLRGLSTEFNACDTTALFLIAHELYQDLSGDTELAKKHKKQIEKAVEYILSHLQNDFFIESPLFSGAEKFALKVTYWKDSEIVHKNEPKYPVIYTLAHVQNMRALKSAAKLLGTELLARKAQRMQKMLSELWDDELHSFAIAIDKEGLIKGVSSDSLHALFYLDTSEVSQKKVEEIVASSKVLETPIGYRVLSPKFGDGYHANTVWPFENALIHAAAVKFGLTHVADVSSRVHKHLDAFPELFIIGKDGKWKKNGQKLQLWTIAAKKYFDTHI